MAAQHIDGSAALDSGLSAARITRHLLLRFLSRIIEIPWEFFVADLRHCGVAPGFAASGQAHRPLTDLLPPSPEAVAPRARRSNIRYGAMCGSRARSHKATPQHVEFRSVRTTRTDPRVMVPDVGSAIRSGNPRKPGLPPTPGAIHNQTQSGLHAQLGAPASLPRSSRHGHT
jgi:hypothetical protein